MPLRPCPCCRRHVLLSEAHCPFCNEKLSSRSGVALAAALGLGLAMTGCGEGHTTGDAGGTDAGPMPVDSGPMFDAAYGPPPFDAGAMDAGMMLEDGGPAPVDAGPGDAGPGDAGPMAADGGINALYGPPPPPDAG